MPKTNLTTVKKKAGTFIRLTEDFKKRANFLIPKPSKSEKKNRHKTVGKLGMSSL